MPNHVHGIIIMNPVGAIHESPLLRAVSERRRMMLSKIVGMLKMTFAKKINLLRETPGQSVWQRNYFEHIVRDDKALERIREYIVSNPERWKFDTENPRQSGNDKFDEWLSAAGKQPTRGK